MKSVQPELATAHVKSTAGKRILALEFLAHGARHCKEPRISPQPVDFMLFMLDCRVILNHSVAMGLGGDAA